MRQIIVMSHGKMAQEIVNSLFMIMGKNENIDYINFTKDMSIEDLNDALINKITTKNPIILTDLKGGSPFNVAFKYKFENECELLAGVNLPVVIEVMNQVVFLNNDNIDDIKGKTNEYIEFV